MYKVLIVDDEILVRIGLKSMINWEAAGYEIIGEAGNGEAAYEKYLMFEPHVLITDIKMPKKDGLWLIKKIREQNANIQIVVLTCYDEFDYVRAALQLQVTDYVLKAEMEEEEIDTIMKKIKEVLNKKDPDHHAEQESRIAASAGEQLIGLLLDTSKPITLVQEGFQKMGLGWNQSRYCFLQLDFSNKLKESQYTIEKNTGILSACGQVVENRLADKGIRCVKKQFGKSLTCLLISDTLLQARLDNDVEGLNDSIFQYFNIRFKSANSKIINRLESIHENPSWIFEISDLLFYYEDGNHIVQAKDTVHPNGEAPMRSDFVLWLCEASENGDSDVMEQYLGRMKMGFISQRLSSVKAKLEMVHIVDGILKKCSIYLRSQNFDSAAIQKSILDAVDMQDAMLQMKKFLFLLSGCIANTKVDNADAVIHKAVDYMEQHYFQKLTLDEVAGYVGISKFYFSNLFNKVYGNSFSSCLNEIRIEEAKKMLKDPQINVKEVAYQAGYNDQQYFSRMFKKYTGMTITKYRKKYS